MESGERSAMRTVVHPNRGSLALIGVVFTAGSIACLGLAIRAAMAGDLPAWLLTPVFLLLATVAGLGAWWSFRKRALKEPALIVDEAGLFDNVSLVKAGRCRWREMNRVWMVGPRWMRMLCVRPENVVPFMKSQNESRSLQMQLNRALFDAPIVIPVVALDIKSEALWEAVSAAAGPSTFQYTSELDEPQVTV
jgi:hypothetical protein